jgi:outer membrane protein TolC
MLGKPHKDEIFGLMVASLASREMMNKFSFFLGSAVQCASIWTQPLVSPREAVRMALTGNKSIAPVAAPNDAAAASIAQARSGLFPNVNCSAIRGTA